MAKFLKFVNGIPTMIEVTASASLAYYDESVPVTTEIGVAGTGYNAAHTVFTLPNSETYDGTNSELRVQVNGVGQVPGVDVTYGGGVSETQVTLTEPVPNTGRVRFIKIYST